MEEKYKGKIRCFFLVCIFLFVACLVPLNTGGLQTTNTTQLTPNGPANRQLATVTLSIFENGRTRLYQAKLSVDDANELTMLMMKWADAQNTNLHTEVLNLLQQQFLTALRQHWELPDEAMRTFERFSPGSLPRYQQRETVFKASITSSGSGLMVPMFLAPRPRLITIWRADTGKTLATNYITKYGYNATGPHLGIALGFIGVGFSSRVPNETRYVMVGGALMTVLFGDTITQIVP